MVSHIAVVGLMGSGKTTVGELVAAHLALPFVDSDHVLEARTGCTAAELAERDGIDELHALEADLLIEQLSEPLRSVIAAAASTIDQPRCRDALSKHTVVWLCAQPAALAQRVTASKHRPLTEDVGGQLRAQHEARSPWFAAVATYTVDVTTASAEDAAAQILAALGRGRP